ncbi:MAG: TonB-dependent receptor [Acidobacteria bacterium]|nr:TonB-dependent receptor [Acidobacteriota bacterium]
MLIRYRAVAVLMLAALVFLVPAAYAQTTGRIVGTITDSTGGALPGVTVSAAGPALQGVRTAVTDAAGEFRLANLPPGVYAVKAELANFKTAEQQKVEVGIDRVVQVKLALAIGGVSESVTVQGAATVVDTSSASAGINATPEIFNRLPTRRDFYAVAQMAPGTSTDASGTTVAGSTGAENTYIIEGLNTTGVAYGTQGKTLNFDFIDEVEVKTGGLPAEYGRMTGGVINVITKSGGNTFHGSGFGFFEGGSLYADDKTQSKRSAGATTVVNLGHLWDAGGSLGGYIVKDRLWFYGAYNPTNRRNNTVIITPLSTPGSPALGSEIPQTRTSNLYSVKLTYKPSSNQSLVFSMFGDPGQTEGNVFAIAGPENTWKGINKFGGSDIVGRYDAVFGGSTLLKVMYGYHVESSKLTGAGSTTPRYQDLSVTPNVTAGGFGGWTDQDYTRDVFKADFSQFFGKHEVKAGGDYEQVAATVGRRSGGAGQLIQKLIQTSTGIIYYRHRYFVDDRASGFDRANSATWKIADPLQVEPKTNNYSVYGQDSWKIASRFTLNAGVRWERQSLLSRDGTQTANLDKNWALRLGAIWDISGDGRSKAYFNYGRFYENIPMDMNIRAFGGELTAFSYNYSPNAADIQPVAGTPSKSSVLGAATTPVDPNLKGQYIDEYLVGYERELGPSFSIGFKYAHRTLGRVIEDFLVPAEGSYFIANPGIGEMGQEMAFYDTSLPNVAAPTPVRKYDSVEINAKKRYSNGWQLMASYVWSKLEGNYDGVFQASTGQLDPNINSAYDYADFLVNAQGPLSNDRRNAIKLDGSYEFQSGAVKGLNLGGSMRWLSGFPVSAYGYSFGYASWEYYLVPRGTLGRSPADWEANLHASYPIRLGGNVKLDGIVDVFNLFNRQAITQWDQRYNLVQDGHCAGVPGAICNGDGGIATRTGTMTPLGTISNATATATNVDFLKKGTNFTGQRSIRVGFRLTF